MHPINSQWELPIRGWGYEDVAINGPQSYQKSSDLIELVFMLLVFIDSFYSISISYRILIFEMRHEYLERNHNSPQHDLPKISPYCATSN